ncbi:MAG TPA: hypothetical protein VHG71_02205, partial [Verrucomicrobiae bacterium]|nr:hypothetical protein [Verrucomicrobiae bacterium]
MQTIFTNTKIDQTADRIGAVCALPKIPANTIRETGEKLLRAARHGAEQITNATRPQTGRGARDSGNHSAAICGDTIHLIGKKSASSTGLSIGGTGTSAMPHVAKNTKGKGIKTMSILEAISPTARVLLTISGGGQNEFHHEIFRVGAVTARPCQTVLQQNFMRTVARSAATGHRPDEL